MKKQKEVSVVISQPMLFPWPGFFESLALADILVYLDDAQFSKGSFINRVQLKYLDGFRWMTVPLEKKGSYQIIKNLKGAGDWRLAHESLLTGALQGAPHATDALELLKRAYQNLHLVDVLIASIELPAQYLNMKFPQTILRASELNITGSSWPRVLEIVDKLGGTRYVTGHGAANYLNHEAFEARGISVDYMKYSLNSWVQRHGDFSPYVSILDLIADMGREGVQVLKPETIDWRSFLRRKSMKTD